MEVEAVFSADERLEIVDTNVEFADRGYWEVREVKTCSSTVSDEDTIPNSVDVSNDDRNVRAAKQSDRSKNNEGDYNSPVCVKVLRNYRKHIDVGNRRYRLSEPAQNSVQYILSKDVISHGERALIKQLGRPTPSFHNGEVDESIYDKFDWACGCSVTFRLFCFPCLLFKKTYLPWTNLGVSQHVVLRAKKHQRSLDHINAYMNFNLAGKLDILLSSVKLRDKMYHNKRVERNRCVLRRLIASVKYCGESENPGVKLDGVVAAHLEETKLFEDPVRTVRDELLDAILAVYRAELKKQIKSSDFVAFEVNEGTNSEDVRQAILTFRYVFDGRIRERFSTFIKPATGPPEEFSRVLLAELQDVIPTPDVPKLIAQCYDGASLVIGTDSDISTVIRKTFPHAHCVHSYSHQFNLTAELAAQSHATVKVFLAHLQSFSRFFARSPKAVSILCEVMKSTVGHPGPTLWDIQNRMATILFEHKESFVDCLKNFADLNRVGTKTIDEVYGLLAHLENPNFLYWLKIFHFITPHIEVFFKQARSGKMLQSGLEHFQRQIMFLKLSIEHMDKSENQGPPRKRPKTHHHAAKEVCNIILKQIEARFNFKSHLDALALFNSTNFKSYRQLFPQKYFEAASQSYPILDSSKLKHELTAMYHHRDFSLLDGIFPLLVFLTENNLNAVMSETYKLINILCTTPMLTSESERCLSTINEVKAFLKRAGSEDKLNALAVLSIEKVFVQSIPDFEDKVIDAFASAKNNTDFIYR